jgi:hypothetical protein
VREAKDSSEKYSWKKWGGRRVLNPPPPESQSGALPDELRPPLKGAELGEDQHFQKKKESWSG